jgi:hypothetical protein
VYVLFVLYYFETRSIENMLRGNGFPFSGAKLIFLSVSEKLFNAYFSTKCYLCALEAV